MHVDKRTGIVTSVEITQSAGHDILDKAAVEAFQRWRFRPGTVEKVRCPITWTQTVEPPNKSTPVTKAIPATR